MHSVSALSRLADHGEDAEQIGASPFRVFIHEGLRAVSDGLSFSSNPRLFAVTRCVAHGSGVSSAVVGQRSRAKVEVRESAVCSAVTVASGRYSGMHA